MGLKDVAYIYSPEIKNFDYGYKHPMKPKRASLVHDLLIGYNYLTKFDFYKPFYATDNDINIFHSNEYINFIKEYSYLSNEERKKPEYGIGMTMDIPAFENFYPFLRLITGGSILGAEILNQHEADVCVSWLGGHHHARKSKASGFCYINDCVIAIMKLLETYNKVMYIDIDVHHGDGVEEAFLTTNRVMTLSYHQFDTKRNFFPGTGDVKDVGVSNGKHFSLNVPLQIGINDMEYSHLFEQVFNEAFDRYRPDAIVIQSGGDSIGGDIIGGFNLSIKCHAKSIKTVLSKNKPTLVLGGGGYSQYNVSKLWAYESIMTLGRGYENEIENLENIPDNIFYYNEYNDKKLFYNFDKKENLNDKKYLNNIREKTFENLRKIEINPNLFGLKVPKTINYKLEKEINDDDY